MTATMGADLMGNTDGVLSRVGLHFVNDLETLDECRRWLGERREVPLCFDTESAGLSPYRDAHRLTQLGDLHHGWAFPPAWFGAATEMLSRYTGRLAAFNAPYDYQVLQVQSGMLPRWERTDDAQLAGHIHDSQRVNKLKPRAAIEIDRRAGTAEKTMEAGMAANKWTWATVPLDWPPYWQYGALDPVLTAHLLNKFLPDIRARFSASYDLECAYSRICTNMMLAGLMIDRPFIHERIAEVSEYLRVASKWLADRWGVANPGSNEQVGAALEAAGLPILKRTATGLPSADKDTMALYLSVYPHASDLITALMGAKKAEAIITRYLGKFLDMAGTDDVVHYSIHSTGAQRTGRSSVTSPPMQTFDRDIPMIRGAFRPRPGHVFVSWDADQIEARLAAHFSGDRQMIADFLEADATGASYFIISAGRIYGEQITKRDKRYTTTKNATYGQIYGSGLETAAATAKVSVEQMRPAYEGFQQRYPQVGAYMAKVVQENRRRNHRPQVRTISGKRLYVDRGKEYSGVDYEIQGSAADIMKHGAVRMDAAGYGPLLRLTVHDELFAEVPAEDARDVLEAGNQILTDRDNFAVPITWSGTIMTERWVKE